MFDNLGLDTREHDAEEIDVLLRIRNQGYIERIINTEGPGAAWGKIIWMPIGGTFRGYPATAAGRTAAFAQAIADGLPGGFWVPPCTIAGDFVVPDYTVFFSIGNRATMNGKCTLGEGAHIKGITVSNVTSSAGKVVAVATTATTAINTINDCGVNAENTGAGGASGVEANGAGHELRVWGSSVQGLATGGGNGWGVEQIAGDVYVSDDGKIHGSTGKFSGTVELFSFDDIIKVQTSTFPQLYNATDAGLTAALAAASADDVVRLPDKCNISGTSWTVPAGVLLKGGGNESVLTGTVTNNGRCETLHIVGNFVNASSAGHVNVTCSSGRGIEQTAGSTALYNCTVDGQTGCVDQYYITNGRVLYCTAGGGAKGKGIYANGSGVELYYSRFAGEIGGQIETVANIDGCSFVGATNYDGLYHTTGTGIVTNSTFLTDGGSGFGLHLTASGLEFSCEKAWDTISGEQYLAFLQDCGGSGSTLDYYDFNVSNPPTQAEVTSGIGAPATKGQGYAAVLDDNGLHTNLYAVLSDGTNWWVAPFSRLGGNAASLITSSANAGSGYVNSITTREAVLVSKTVGATTYQVMAFWDSDGKLAFAKRDITSQSWTIYTTAITISDATDVHNHISLGIDPDGYLHVSYDMHNAALLYRKSSNPIATFDGTLSGTLSMLGTNETDVTYPTFFNDEAGKLYVMIRDGIAHNGDWYFYTYDHSTTTWSASTGTGTGGKLLDGKSASPTEGAYIWSPRFDDSGNLHITFTWRKDGAGGTDSVGNHDLGYIKWDKTNWTKSTGAAQTVPITPANFETALSIPVENYLLNSGHMDVDGNDHPHMVYVKADGSTISQIRHLWHNGTSWVDSQLTANTTITWLHTEDQLPRPDIAIDRSTNVAYVIFHSDDVGDGLWVYRSDPNDFTTWTSYQIYATDFGKWEPAHDRQRWDDAGKLHFPIAEWFSGGSAWTIRMLEYEP